MTIQRSDAFNAFLDTLVRIYESGTTTVRAVCSVRMFETLFFQHTKEKMERHTRQIIRDEMKRRGYKIVIGLDIGITKLPVVEVPVKQWPLLIRTLVERVKAKADSAPTKRMRFTLTQFKDFATIWPTAPAFQETVKGELRKVGIVALFHTNHVIVLRDDACSP